MLMKLSKIELELIEKEKLRKERTNKLALEKYRNGDKYKNIEDAIKRRKLMKDFWK